LYISNKAMGCNIFLKVHFFNSHLDFFPENFWVAMSTDSDFIRTFPPRKRGSMVSGFSVFWLINVGYIKQMFHK